MNLTEGRTRPIEIWRAPDHRWHWRCNICGLLRGGWRHTQPAALRRGLAHYTTHHTKEKNGS